MAFSSGNRSLVMIKKSDVATRAFTQTAATTATTTFDLSGFGGVILELVAATLSVTAKSDGSTWGVKVALKVTFSDASTATYTSGELTFTATQTSSQMDFQWPFGIACWPNIGSGNVMSGTFTASNEIVTQPSATGTTDGVYPTKIDFIPYRSTTGTGTATTNAEEVYLGGYGLK